MKIDVNTHRTMKVSDLASLSVPASGLQCRLQGYLFYRIVPEEAPVCYLAEDQEVPRLLVTIPERYADFLLREDSTFGMLVGGDYAYFGMECVVEGLVCSTSAEKFRLSRVSSIRLIQDDIFRDFLIPPDL